MDCYCGNHSCDPGESRAGCAMDCPQGRCGDAVCDPEEDGASCQADCPSICGNGSIEYGEECEGVVPAGVDCASVAGHLEGAVSCNASCLLDTSDCHSCGDGLRQGNEACDGDDLGEHTCPSVGFGGGLLRCDIWCQFDTSSCVECGNADCQFAAGEDSTTCLQDCGWTAVSAGAAYTCGIRADTTAWCWGRGGDCQLGDGMCAPADQPRRVSGLTGVTQISASEQATTCALSGGQLYCWGFNDCGQVGDGTTLDRNLPALIDSLSGVAEVAVGGRSTCARLTNGETWCWGSRWGTGHLSPPDRCTGSGLASHLPLLVPDIPTTAVALIAGWWNACVATQSGSVWCWGGSWPSNGGVGYSTYGLPFEVIGSGGAVALSRSNSHACLRRAGGEAYCWGFNEYGQLGVGFGSYGSLAAVEVTVVNGISAVAAGGLLYDWVDYGHSCVQLSGDGKVYCWGYNAHGQLGDGTTTDSVTPRIVTGLTDVSAIAAGTYHSCAITTAGQLHCWGRNDEGQLGNGSNSNSPVPVVVP